MRERRRHAKADLLDLLAPMRRLSFGRRRINALKRLADCFEIILTDVGQDDHRGAALEEGGTDETFQVSYLLAHRALRDVKFLCRQSEALPAGRGFEIAQCVEGWKVREGHALAFLMCIRNCQLPSRN